MFLRLILLISFLAMLTACSEDEGLPRDNVGSNNTDTETLPDGGGPGDDGNAGDDNEGDDSGSGDDNDNTDGDDNDNTDGDDNNTNPPLVDETQEISPAFAVAQLPYSFQLDQPSALMGEITYKILHAPSWMVVDKNTGLLTGLPSDDAVSAFQTVEAEASGENGTVTFHGELVVHHNAALRDDPRIDFYDTPFDDSPRQYRNDLTGDLAGEVQFVQTHAMASKNKINHHINKEDQTKSQYMPDPIALRGALLLFIPEQAEAPITVDVQVNAPGKQSMNLTMQPPQALPQADKVSELTYSKKTWFVELPWDFARNGLTLEFTVDKDAQHAKSGVLPSDEISFSRATDIVFNTLRLGMLTPPRPHDTDHFSLQDPILAATDYFQTLPVSKMIMASYNDVELTRTIVNKTYDEDGDYEETTDDQYIAARVYDKDIDKHSDTTGDVYSGDMRENVGKSQTSVGINLANTGITSWDLSQNYPKAQKIITSHHAHGVYQCSNNSNCPESGYWIVGHGLSGGNGISTIYASRGNEASHEWGHAYGLGHWPGQNLTDDCRWADHHATTGWGFIGHRNRLRNSVYGIANGGESRETCDYRGTRINYQKGDYMFSRDAMSGGNYGGSPLSAYTFYTSFSARLIQQDLNNWYIPDTQYASGYKQWDTETGQFEHVDNPTLNGEKAPVPVKVGVPVVTIWGGYDPVDSAYTLSAGAHPDPDKRAAIYPAIYANYGNVFELKAPSATGDACWVEVSNASGQSQQVEVQSQRHSAESINQLHFNLEADFKPTLAILNCRRDGNVKEFTRTEFDGVIPELPPLAIVGQEHGFEQLKAREMQEIAQEIMALAPDNIMQANDALLTKIASYSVEDLKQKLDPAAWGYAEELLNITQGVANVETLINYGEAKGLNQNEQKQSLADYLLETGLAKDNQNLIPQGDVMYGFWGPYADKDTAYLSTVPGADNRLYVKPVSDGEAEQHRWVRDLQGRIHPANDLSLCLTATGPITLTACDSKNIAQKWEYVEDQKLQANDGTGQCMDNYASQGNHMNLYGCGGGWNQRWTLGEANQDPWFAFGNANTIKQVLAILAQ